MKHLQMFASYFNFQIHIKCIIPRELYPELYFFPLRLLILPNDLKTIKPLFLSRVCQFLARCQSPSGGFAGGPGQHAHLAPTYAAVNALCIIGTEEAYNVIDRYSHCLLRTLLRWLKKSLKCSQILQIRSAFELKQWKNTLKMIERWDKYINL